MRLGSFCRRRAASATVAVSVVSGLPPASEQCLSSAGCLSALGPPGPRPPTATRRAPPSTSEGAYGSETVPPPPDTTLSGPSPCSCPVVDTPAAASRQPLPSGTIFTDFGPAGGFFPSSGPIFAVFSPAGGPFLQLGTVFAFFSPHRPAGHGHFAGSVVDRRRTCRSAKLTA